MFYLLLRVCRRKMAKTKFCEKNFDKSNPERHPAHFRCFQLLLLWPFGALPSFLVSFNLNSSIFWKKSKKKIDVLHTALTLSTDNRPNHSAHTPNKWIDCMKLFTMLKWKMSPVCKNYVFFFLLLSEAMASKVSVDRLIHLFSRVLVWFRLSCHFCDVFWLIFLAIAKHK